jgi:uncharacterized membrane protein
MNSMQYSIYEGFIEEPTISVILLAYFAWTLMAFAMKKFVMDDENFNFTSLFTVAPFLGLVIYTCINIAILSLVPDWTYMMSFTDIVFGTSMWAFVALIALMFKQYLN